MNETTIDTTVYRFRTAVGGFHKGDVAEYISKTAQLHRTETQQKDKLIDALQQENLELRQQLNILMASSAILEEDPVETVDDPEKSPELTVLELEAYRRAEYAERMANQRAKKLYTQMETICHSTGSEFEAAKTAVEETAQAVFKQAKALDEACRKLTDALQTSREELSALDAMIPDPAETTEEIP